MTKTPRNKSLDIRDHAGLMHKLCKKFHARLAAAQILSADEHGFDEVMGELNLAFVKAARGYKEETGFTFTAFLERCCQNHFNKYASKLLHEQYGSDQAVDLNETTLTHRGLGYISVQELAARGEDADGDVYGGMEDDTFARPDEVVDAQMTLAGLFKDPTLLPETRAYIALVINPSMQMSETARARIRGNTAAIRSEISRRWGVAIPSIRV